MDGSPRAYLKLVNVEHQHISLKISLWQEGRGARQQTDTRTNIRFGKPTQKAVNENKNCYIEQRCLPGTKRVSVYF